MNKKIKFFLAITFVFNFIRSYCNNAVPSLLLKKSIEKVFNGNQKKTIDSRSVSISTVGGNALEVTTNKFTVNETSGDTAVGGTLDVTGTTTLSSLSTGVVKSNGSGVLSSSTIVDADINASAAISDTKLATISTSGKVSNSATTATNANTASAIVARDGSGNFNTNMITLVGTTTNSTDAATKSYVDSVAQGLDLKESVRVIATTNQTLSGVPVTPIDGVTMVADDRILLNGQTTASENGIWIIKIGSWVRPSDFSTGSSASGSFAFVAEGTDCGDCGFVCTTDAPNDIVDTDNLSFTHFTGANTTGGVNVGSGIGQVFRDKTGNNLNFKTLLAGNFMSVTNNANDISIDADGQTTNVANSLVSRDGSGNFAAGSIKISDGSVGSPSLAFNNETNTGVYRSGSSLRVSTTGSDRAIFDSNGARHTSNYRMAAFMSSDRTITSSTETVRFDSEHFDPSNSFNTTTYTFTAPVTGIYFLAVQVGVDASNDSIVDITLKKNGSPVSGYAAFNEIEDALSGIKRELLTITGCISLSSGDTVKIDYTGNDNTDVIKSDSSLFSIHLLSI